MQQPRVAEPLSHMAVLDRQGIPNAILCGKNEEHIEAITALGTLRAFSLISSDEDREVFELPQKD